jgi:tyrosine-protein kinase Etk/Wzc
MVQLAIAEAQTRAAQARQGALKALVAKEKSKLADAPDLAADLGSLQREADVAAAVYVELVRHNETAKLHTGEALSPVEVLTPAVEPEKPIKPRQVLNAIIGFIFGLVIAAMLVAVVELVSDPLRSERDARSELDLPVFARIPMVSRRELAQQASTERAASKFSDAFAALRTNLRLATPEGMPPVLLVAGSAAREGRTTVASNLATALAQSGMETLLLDADMRSPQVHKRLGVAAGDGLSDVLAGKCNVADCVQETQWPNFSLLQAGAAPANPVELLEAEQARAALVALRERFAAIVVDSPPWPCPEVLQLAPLADGVVLVLQTGRTGREGAARLVEQLTNIGKRPLAMSIIQG